MNHGRKLLERKSVQHLVSVLESRISRLEDRILAPICNCRIATLFHTAKCLEAIIEGQLKECPAHRLRNIGPFFRVPLSELVLPSDRKFCHCSVLEQREKVEPLIGRDRGPNDEFRAQFVKVKMLFKSSETGKKLCSYAFAPLIDEVRRDKDVGWNVPLEESKSAYRLAFDYDARLRKWQTETGHPLPGLARRFQLLARQHEQKRQTLPSYH